MSSSYALLKILHLAGVVVWIGPPLGAFLMQLLLKRSIGAGADDVQFQSRIRRAFAAVLFVEHVALVVLLIGAVGMIISTGGALLQIRWVRAKIVLFCAVILPIEILDIWWGQISMLRAVRNHERDLPAACRRYDRFAIVCIPILLLSWAAFFWLGTAKPG